MTEQNIPNQSSNISTPAGSKEDLIKMATKLLDKLPPLPEEWKKHFMKWYPLVLIIGGILALPWILAGLGLASVGTVLSLGGIWGLSGGMRRGGLGLIFSTLDVFLSLSGGIQMRSMKKTGWKLALISEGLGVFYGLTGSGSMELLFSLIFIYFLWQVKENYK